MEITSTDVDSSLLEITNKEERKDNISHSRMIHLTIYCKNNSQQIDAC